MSTHTHTDAGNAVAAYQTANDASLILQLRRVHCELCSTLALAAQTPPGDRYDAALQMLHDEINALGREFLRLAEELLARGGANLDPAL